MNENTFYFSGRLRKALQAMLTNPLTVVEAPTGYGKSVAVTVFLEKAAVTTIMATASHESLEKFWPDFCRGLMREAPDAGDVIEALLRLGLPRDYTQNRAALELLRQIPFPQQTFLVFDDCHNLPRSFIGFCQSLAVSQGALPNVQVVYITRHALAGDRDAARPQGSSYIDQSTFTLTPPEIREFYALYGISLNPGEERALHTCTKGWIFALYVSRLLYKENADISAFPALIATEMKEALRVTVYASLSAEARNLLFALAPMERFTGVQASRLYGESAAWLCRERTQGAAGDGSPPVASKDATELLEELTRKNAFVTFDPISQFYSPHAIFRQFLLELFKEDDFVPPKRRQEIYRACGAVFHEAKELASAIEAWHKAQDFESALAALEENITRNLVTEKAGMYFAMFKDCPEEILERHIGASFKYAIAAFSAGDFQAFGARLKWLGKRCAILSQEAEANHWQGELHVLLALNEFNDIKAMSRHHTTAFALLNKKRTSLYGPDSPWTLGSPSVLFMFYRESGKLREELQLMHDCMPGYYLLADNHGAGGEFLMEAEALYHAGESEEAEGLCRKALGVAGLHNQRGNEFCAMFLQMRLALLTGNVDALFGQGEKRGLLADMRGMIARGRNYFLLHTADLCEGWLYAALGLYTKIPVWLRSPLSGDSPLYAFAQGYYYIVHGRAQLLAGNHDDVIEDFNKELKKGKFHNNLLFSVYAHIYLAAAFHKKNQSHEATSALQTALSIALPDALYMPFVENYDLIGPLLANALSGKEHQKELARIEVLAEQMKEKCEPIRQEIQAADRLALLTARELEVALLVGKGLANQEVADKLHIKESTIKTHLTSIFKILKVEGRAGLRKFFNKFFIE